MTCVSGKLDNPRFWSKNRQFGIPVRDVRVAGIGNAPEFLGPARTSGVARGVAAVSPVIESREIVRMPV